MATARRAPWLYAIQVACAAMLCAAFLGACRAEQPPALREDSGASRETPQLAATAGADAEAHEDAAGAMDRANTEAVAASPQAAAERDEPLAGTADVPLLAVSTGADRGDEELARMPIALTPAMLAAVTRGMPIEDVRETIGAPGHVITQADVDSAIMRWTDGEGNLLVAKFENGRLQRKYLLAPTGSPLNGEVSAHTIERADYEGIVPGMTVEEVSEALGVPPRQVTSERAEVIIFSWRDAAGSSFVARFEDGRLIHKSGFFVAPLREPDEETAAAIAEMEGEADSEGEAPIPVRRDDRRLVREEPPRTPVYTEEAAPQLPQVTSVEPVPRVRVVGGRRDTGDGAPDEPRSSYQPRAKLPDFTWGLRRGAYEMRIENTTNTRVQAGLRSGQYGKDITIPANSTRTVGVDRANYQLFYIYDDAPFTLHRGASIDLTADFLNDVRITLFNQSYDVEAIDHAAEFWGGNP